MTVFWKAIVGSTWSTCVSPRCPQAVGSKSDNLCQTAQPTSTEHSLHINHFWATRFCPQSLFHVVVTPCFLQRSPSFCPRKNVGSWCNWPSWRVWWRASWWCRMVRRSWQRSSTSVQRRSSLFWTSTKMDSCSSTRWPFSLSLHVRTSARTRWINPSALWQILTHSRVRDGIWLTPENLREIYTGLEADKDGNGRNICILQLKIG